MLDAMFLIQRSLYLRLKQIRHPHGMTDLYVGSFWENSHSGERIVQMVFIRFQYHSQRHFVVLVVARLVVDITIMQMPIATRRFMFIPMDLQDLSVGLL